MIKKIDYLLNMCSSGPHNKRPKTYRSIGENSIESDAVYNNTSLARLH